MNQSALIQSLPEHLRGFVQYQDYSRYTPQDHALWRCLMAQLSERLQQTAHAVYMDGLRLTGISLDHIPSIEEMNEALAALGWRAVVVDGFIPPAVFMEFQALRILVIALDMRAVEHTLYTPAPDILHEAAGHAPFIVDVDYAEFLQLFGEVGMRAIASKEDHAVYDAIRALSDLKACANGTPADIAEAEARLEAVTAANTELSEAALLARLHWWTVEYGLVGAVDDYRIFGAGLLSSLGESVHCLDDDAVQKLPLTVDAINTAYDITREQPQLFVTSSCKHLSQVLREFANSMAYQQGGLAGLQKAIAAASVCTAQYQSGLQVSGRFCDVRADAVGNVIWLRTEGPTQLAYQESQLPGHGTQAHASGFSSPVGLVKDFSRCLSEYSVDELKAHGIVVGDSVRLAFLSGITVSGKLVGIHRQDQRNLVFSFENCTATDLAGDVLYRPEWGVFDMAVGARIPSVFGGSADRAAYPLHTPPASHREPILPAQDDALLGTYAAIDAVVRGNRSLEAGQLEAWARVAQRYPDEWLLRVEFLRLEGSVGGVGLLKGRARSELETILQSKPALAATLRF
ncbi:aromatic amino acid hydroxylase [Parahalioglobus pacificus]|uniref:Phenylalanine 4-monooxygenase n=1 Tax=Parahalioglobus pacificus TaxID=930806 RepID=A0A918XLU9_9GAMM|nr:aromatic amino acid hydroxylase [Halioglobus pacificus]GHD38448.1 phenylalanine 4-monooxygenase [Halioglobus pacificus]